MTTASPRRGLVAAALAIAVLAPSAARAAERAEALPKELEGVTIEQKLGAMVPLDARFIDENGQGVALGEFFAKGRPVILDLGYYGCPMLCGLVFNGLLDGLKPLDFIPGRDFEVVFVSIDPNETPELAKAKKRNYLEAYGRPGVEAGFHFLTGDTVNVKRLADAVGFHYRYVPEDRQYAHAAGIFLLTPEGKISRLLPGIQFEPRTLRLAVAEASSGKVGTVVDQFLLFCFHYDAQAGRYIVAATRLMQAGGAATALALLFLILTLWSRERRRKAASPEANA